MLYEVITVRLETPEMVDAHVVVELQVGADAFDPPCEVLLLHRFPVKERVAPALPRGAEIVRRYSGYM